MSKMKIVRTDINDTEHPLKTGEMFLDRTTNTLYVGGQMNTADISFWGIFNLIKASVSFKGQSKAKINEIFKLAIPAPLVDVKVKKGKWIDINENINIDISIKGVDVYGTK